MRARRQQDPAGRCAIEPAEPAPVTPESGGPQPVAGLAVRRSPVEPDPLGGTAIPPEVTNALRRRRGAGAALSATLRDAGEQALGHDLAGVRVHADAEAASLADAVQAVAFTHGSDIYFGQGSYRPGDQAGQRLIAHELGHVVQPADTAAVIGRADDPAESAADRSAESIVSVLRRQQARGLVSYGGPVNDGAEAESRQVVPALRRHAARHPALAGPAATGEPSVIRRTTGKGGRPDAGARQQRAGDGARDAEVSDAPLNVVPVRGRAVIRRTAKEEPELPAADGKQSALAALRRRASAAGPEPAVEPAVIRRVWAYQPDLARQNAQHDQYLWFGNPMEKPTRVPGLATRFRLTPTGDIAGTPADERRLERDTIVGNLFSTAAYSNFRGATGGRGQSSLNPFGRFNTDISGYAYLAFEGPLSQVPQAAPAHALAGQLAIQAVSNDMVSLAGGTAAPTSVTTPTGIQLVPIASDPFGVTYGPATETPQLPRQDGQATDTRQPGPLPNAAVPILEALRGAPVAVTAYIDQERVGAFRGGRHSEDSQKKIMGASADDVAAAAGLVARDEHYDPADTASARKHGFEWLHLIAYHLGGGESGPQVSDNLVVGTTAANTWMIMIETLLSLVIEDGTASAMTVTVNPSWRVPDLRIAETINYDVHFRLPDGKIVSCNLSFDALATQTPYEATHRHFREELYRRLQPATAPPPMSEEAQHMYD